MKHPKSNRTHYFISSAVLVLSRTLVTVGGFMVVMILAAKFGITALADAYFIARLVPITLLSSLGIAFNLAFVPVYMRTLTDTGADEATGLANSFLNGALIVSALLTILYAIFAGPIVSLMAPGFSPETHASAVWMTRIMAPAILLSSLHAVFDSVLNAQQRFITSALSSLFIPAGALLGVSLLADQWGITGLAAGAVAGFIAQAAVLAPIVRRYFTGHRWSLPRLTPATSRLARFLGLTIFVIAGWQIIIVIDRMFGSMLGEGAVTALSLGTAVIGLVPIIVAAPVYKVLYPGLVQHVQERRLSDIRKLLRDNFVVVTFITLPVMAILMMFAPLVTQLAFGYGHFDDTTVRTSQVIFYGALGLPGSVSGILLFYYFLVTRNVGMIVTTFVASITANALLNWVLMNLMGIGGIALATTLMTLFRTGVMSLVASRSLGGSVTVGLMIPVLKSTGAMIVAAGAMHGLASVLSLSLQQGTHLALFSSGAVIAGAGLAVYLLTSLVLRNEALLWLQRTVRQRKQVGRGTGIGESPLE
jgi:putative peptidoglycan lipid II flippase